MKLIPEVQFMGQFGDFPNYKNYKALKSKATVAELLDLLNHKNSVVACYSSLALLENEYGDLKYVFDKLIRFNIPVTTIDGCLYDFELPARLFYFQYKSMEKADDNFMNYMVSVLDNLETSEAYDTIVHPKE